MNIYGCRSRKSAMHPYFFVVRSSCVVELRPKKGKARVAAVGNRQEGARSGGNLRPKKGEARIAAVGSKLKRVRSKAITNSV